MSPDLPYFFMLMVLLDTAHVVSPFVLSATNKGFRKVVLREWKKYIIPPAAVFLVFMASGMTWLSIPVLLSIYGLVNFWHFSMQNFGVLQLIFSKARQVNFLIAFFGTAAGMAFIMPAMQAHHWLTDIGLSQRAAGRGRLAYLLIVTAIAPIAICWNGVFWRTFHWTPPHVLIEWAKVFLVFRYSLSFAHFTSSARCWRFSDPQVRETIGRDLLGVSDGKIYRVGGRGCVSVDQSTRRPVCP